MFDNCFLLFEALMEDWRVIIDIIIIIIMMIIIIIIRLGLYLADGRRIGNRLVLCWCNVRFMSYLQCLTPSTTFHDMIARH